MDYSQPAVCLALLQKLHPTDFRATHASLVRIVNGLLDASPAPNQHLEVLEAARETLAFVQGEMAHAYAIHPQPAARSQEGGALERVVSLWKAVARSYARIADSDAREGTLEDQRALLAQRRVFYEGLVLVEYYRAHLELPPGLWHAVHVAYDDAVRNGLAQVRVTDPLNEVWRAQSAQEAYIGTLLVELANPYGRGERELNWVVRWAQRFAPYCALDADIEGHKPSTYGIDTDGDSGLRPLGLLAHTPSVLRFDGSGLATQIQAVMAQFKRGVTPASLGLGNDCSASSSARLLLSLYRPWGLAASGRRFPRRRKSGVIDFTGDWLAIGYAIKGELFQQPVTEQRPRAFRDDMSLLTSGERVATVDGSTSESRRREAQAADLGMECERWELMDQSVGGFRLRRSGDGPRLDHHQLVGIRPPDADQLLIADLSWLMYRNDGTLEVGINVLPGVPRVVGVRRTIARNGSREPFHQAFMLPPSPALKTAGTLVLPPAWFKKDRILDVQDGQERRQVRLLKVSMRGANFDQCSFAPVEQEFSPA